MKWLPWRTGPRTGHPSNARACARRRPGQPLWSAQGGNVAIIFALCAVIIVPVAIFAIDYSRASRVKAELQEGLDSATLAAARAPLTTSVEDAGNAALLPHASKVSGLQNLKQTFVLQGDLVVGTATADVDPYFPLMNGGKPFKLNARTEVKRAIGGSLEVALVLDTTFSMTGLSGTKSKLDVLKVAAKDLVQTITKESTADVKIAVVPFAQYVNVGVSRRSESWVDVGADYTTPNTRVCVPTYNLKIMSEQVCSSYEKKTCTGIKDGTSYTYACNGACLKTTTQTYPLGKPGQTCTGSASQTFKFFGCVGSPAYPKNVEDSDSTRKYPGLLETGTSCGSEITPLTNKQGPVIAAINALTAVGETYIPSGMAWGLNALSQVKPLTEAAPYDPSGSNTKPRKAIVLMTDGENTKFLQPKSTPIPGLHNGSSAASGASATQHNDFTLELCTNAKKAGIEIYTIAFQVSNGPAKTMLEKCASDSGHYYDASDSAKLAASFAEIAESLKNIFISR